MKALGILLALTLFPMFASAQTDEIQVYDGGLAEPGKFNLTWHQNFTPIGQKPPRSIRRSGAGRRVHT